MPESPQEWLAKRNPSTPGLQIAERGTFLDVEPLQAVAEKEKRTSTWSLSDRQSSDAPSHGRGTSPSLLAASLWLQCSLPTEQDAHQDLQQAEVAGCPFCGLKVHPPAKRPGKTKRHQIRREILEASEVRDAEQRMQQYRQVGVKYGVYACHLMEMTAQTSSSSNQPVPSTN
eukprot:TRINITY_DN19321_c0_g1_i4.p1 TRINITY_DN19321_c0_g1~~TRINITY_DN19321_c0_g1_i4.p1  ORF type:complete len:172 (+),score=27.10 TRINITY_DN19321_c0_g1_i4:91-606(+)